MKFLKNQPEYSLNYENKQKYTYNMQVWWKMQQNVETCKPKSSLIPYKYMYMYSYPLL